jgi:hypothetical protein
MPKSGVGKSLGSYVKQVLNTRAYDERWVGCGIGLVPNKSTGERFFKCLYG